MITPCFSITQTEGYIELTIEAPYTKICPDNQPEVCITDDSEVLFHSTPYYLRLPFDKGLLKTGDTISYKDGIFTVRVLKENPGEHFEELEVTSKNSATQENDKVQIEAPKYGFGNNKHGVLSKLEDELETAIDLEKPDEVLEADRTKLRQQNEDESFDESHYLADLFENEDINELLSFSPAWLTDEGSCDLSDDDRNVLIELPINKHVQPSSVDQKKIVYYGLVDILFAYAYDFRTTQGYHNVESGWTISKISSTLSWLDSFSDIPSVVRSFFRRSVCFPLYRNWNLSEVIKKDVCRMLKKGKKFILKCLLKIKELLNDDYNHHVLNDLYIDDYCIWIQHIKDEILVKLANDILKVKVNKEDMEFDLPILEDVGKTALEEKSDKKHSDEEESGDDDDDDSEDETEVEESEDEDTGDDDDDDEEEEEDDEEEEEKGGDDDSNTGTDGGSKTDSIECQIKTLNIEEK